jgi:hypothetical protein
MEIAIEKLVAICFLLIGLSHIFQPRAWSEFFIRFREKGAVGSLQLGFFHLPLALLIVSFHNIWHGLPIIVTIIGWAQLLKTFLYIMWPKHGLRMLSRVSLERSWQFIAGGVFSLAISGLVVFSLWQRNVLI